MSDMYANNQLVLHESHAQPIVQEEAVMAAAFLGSDSPLQLSAGTTTMVVPRQHISSSPSAKKRKVSPVVEIVVLAKGKEKVCDVSLQLQSAAVHAASVLDRFGSSSCFAKGMDSSVLSSSPPLAKENDGVPLLGNMTEIGAGFASVGVAPFLLPKAAGLGSIGPFSSPSFAEGTGANVHSSCPSIAKVNEAPMLGNDAGRKVVKNDSQTRNSEPRKP